MRDELIEEHPLQPRQVKNLILSSFEKLLQTKIGPPENNIKVFKDVDLSNQVEGDFLETITAQELEKTGKWRHGKESEKDFIYKLEPFFSTELKTSGQKGGKKIFGNRSYAQKVEEENAKKSKTGYYITVNFYKDMLYLIRFGWLDFNDWEGQDAESGQAATLKDHAYEHKLKTIQGEYRLNGPIAAIEGVGSTTEENIKELIEKNGKVSIREFIEEYEKLETDTPWRIEDAYKNVKELEERVSQE